MELILKTEPFEHCLLQPFKLTIEALQFMTIPQYLEQNEFKQILEKYGFPLQYTSFLFYQYQLLTNQEQKNKVDTDCLILFLFIQLRGNIRNSAHFVEKSPNAHFSPKQRSQNVKYDQEQLQNLKYVEENIEFLQDHFKTEKQLNLFFEIRKGKFQPNPQISKISLQNFFISQQQGCLIIGLSKSVFLKKNVDFQDIKILSCEDSQIFIDSPLNSLFIQNICNCRIFVSSVKYFCTIDRCENLQITLVSGSLKIQNTIDSQFNYYGPIGPCILGDSRNLTFGPNNSNYIELLKQIQSCNIPIRASFCEKYKEAFSEKDYQLNFQTIKDFDIFVLPNEFKTLSYSLFNNQSFEELEQNAQNFSQFQEQFEKQDKYLISIPILIKQDFRDEILQRHQNKINLAQQIQKSGLNKDQMKILDQALQSSFKEWAIQSNSMKNLTDLVKLIE